MATPQKLDLYLEGLSAFQDAACELKAGDPLALQPQDGVRLACVTQAGAVVGLVPADKRSLLTRGPWAGTVRSVKRTRAAPAPESAVASRAAEAAATDGVPQVAEAQQSVAATLQGVSQKDSSAEDIAVLEADQSAQPASPQQEQQQPAMVVQHVLVRFTPEEQRWLARQHGQPADQQGMEEEGTARLTTEQYEQLASNEEVRWMLRDERLQQLVSEIDSAPDRERALHQALQAPNFKEFADKVLGVVAPEPS